MSQSKRKSNSATNKYKGPPVPTHTHTIGFSSTFPYGWLKWKSIHNEQHVPKFDFQCQYFVLMIFFFHFTFMRVLLLTEMPVTIVFKRSFRLGLGSACSARASQYQLLFIPSVFLKPGSKLLISWLLHSSFLYSFTYYKKLVLLFWWILTTITFKSVPYS